MKSTVLVVEDDERLNEIICDYFDVAGYDTYGAFNGIEAIEIFGKKSVSLVILDVMMPGLDGWSVCRRIRRKSDALIIMLTARADEEDKLLGFELGVDEYVTKPFSPKVLVARANALMKRSQGEENHMDDTIIKHGMLTVDTDKMLVKVGGETVEITPREYQLLLIFIKNPSKVFKRDVLIESIWGYDYIGDGRVVDTNVKTLRKKLLMAGTYIRTVVGLGYKFEV